MISSNDTSKVFNALVTATFTISSFTAPLSSGHVIRNDNSPSDVSNVNIPKFKRKFLSVIQRHMGSIFSCGTHREQLAITISSSIVSSQAKHTS